MLLCLWGAKEEKINYYIYCQILRSSSDVITAVTFIGI